MRHIKTSRFILIGLATITASLAAQGCSSAEDAASGCSGLDTSVRAQATVKAFADAAIALRDRAVEVEGKFRDTCNKINGELGLDTTKTTAEGACSVLRARVQAAADAGVNVYVTVAGGCTVDARAQADCEVSCRPPTCDVEASCTGGEVVVACNGGCSGQCDVQKPEFSCMGTCKGECKLTAAIQCEGSCNGQCTGGFEGQCEAGCSAGFEGTCGGECEGTCDGMNSSGKCDGKCVGTCSAKASGSCNADCSANFKGECKGQCSGSCIVEAGGTCNGKCTGTCSYTPPDAKCEGECHGECDAEVSPPRCTGSVACESGDCKGSCEAQVQAKASCTEPTVTVVVEGDAELQAAIEANARAWGEAALALTTLVEPIKSVGVTAGKSATALGEVGVSGATCFASAVTASAKASASISVSVSASASVQGSGSAG